LKKKSVFVFWLLFIFVLLASNMYSANFITNPYHPIMIAWKNNSGDFSQGNVIGGSRGSKWFRLESFNVTYKGKLLKPETFQKNFSISDNKNYGRIDLVKGNEIFRFYSSNKRITTAKAQRCGLYTQWSTGDEMLGVDFEPFKADENFLVGINGNWNAIPNMMKPLDKNTYTVDIDHDGRNEILSMTEIGRGDSGSILSFTVEKQGYKILLSKDENTSAKYCSMYAFDLNGDRKSEILLKITFGYGVLVKVFEVSNTKVTQVLSFYDGD
jgi:hypothetical protein